MGARLNLTGQKFNRLTAIKDVGTRHRRRLWLCQCDCGKTAKVVAGMLKIGKIKSCGCLNKEPTHILPIGTAAFNELYSTYRCVAKGNNREFSLSKKEFRKLTSSNCYYCDITPSQEVNRKHTNGVYVYNGIDRVDNEKGYTTANCVSCCKRCNYSKRNYSKEEFYSWVKRIYNHVQEYII